MNKTLLSTVEDFIQDHGFTDLKDLMTSVSLFNCEDMYLFIIHGKMTEDLSDKFFSTFNERF